MVLSKSFDGILQIRHMIELFKTSMKSNEDKRYSKIVKQSKIVA